MHMGLAGLRDGWDRAGLMPRHCQGTVPKARTSRKMQVHNPALKREA